MHIIDAAGQVAERAAGQVVEAAGQAADVAGHAAGQAAERASAVAERAVAHVPRWTPAPPNASAIEYHNYLVIQRESFAMGVINASAPFLPVFVARLGGSDFDVGLLTALPALAGLVFAIPAAGYLRARRNVVPVFATSRLLASLAYVATAIATLIVPTPWVVPAVLGVWLVATIPGTVGMVAFAVVMDGAAGPRGRYDLLSRRWSIMGLTTAISVVVIGQILQALMFPVNYQLVFMGFSLAGVISYRYNTRITLTDQERRAPATGSLRQRIRAVAATVRAEPRFTRYVWRKLIYSMGLRLVAPLVPLFYVREVHASDAWIGVIATAQSLALLSGYVLWRRQSRVRGPRFVLLAATAVSAAFPAALALVRPEPLVAAVVAVGALFTAGTDLAMFDELMKTIPRGQGLTFAAIDQSATNAGGILAPLLGATLAQAIGIPNALVVGAGISLVGFALFALDRPSAKGDGGGLTQRQATSAGRAVSGEA